jgi:hypothetical protein
MKTIITSCMFLFLITGVALNAQVKIGDNPNTIDPNSLFELESSTKGLLAPRVVLNDLNSAAPLTLPVPEGMLVYSQGGTLSNGFYYWNGVKWLPVLNSQNVRDNYVLVKSAADFPAPVGGIITLVAGTLYEINGTIILTNRIDLNDCTLAGRDMNNDRLIYTPATGELFTGTNGGTVQNMTISAPTPGAKVFNVDAGGSATKSLLIQTVYVVNSNDVGLVKGYGGFVVLQTAAFTNNTNGITFQNIGNLIEINTFWIADNHNTYQTLVGSFTKILMMGGNNDVLAIFSAKALNITGVTSITDGASVKNSFFSGNGIYIVGSFSNDWEVEAFGLATEKDDVATGNIYISTTAATIFAATNTPVKVLGTTTSANLFRATATGSNRITYTGKKTRRLQVMCSLTGTQGSTNIVYAFFIAKNGVVLPESKQVVKFANSSDQQSVTVSCTVQLAPNDFIEIWVQNQTSTASLTVQSLNMSIR